MDFQTDAIVIGAGVVGLAVGRALAQRGLETIIVERRGKIGEETSSRNSEVIHAGIYYPENSLKAQTCVRGRKLLYEFAASHNVAHKRCGKLVVASCAADEARLQEMRANAERCGVADLELLDRSQLRLLEPAVEAPLALWSPSTGIVDSHQFMLALQGDFESAGGMLALNSPLESGSLGSGGLHELKIGGEMPAAIACRLLVNATGLYASDVLSRLSGGSAQLQIPPQLYAKGHYYSYFGKAPFSRLVYPLPGRGGLGVHATLDLAGQVRFGPDVRWIDNVDYSFDDSARADFEKAVRSYFPALEAQRLQPAYTGIRPKISGKDERPADFCILRPREHGITGFCSLHGIESPGLTAALAIAENVCSALNT